MTTIHHTDRHGDSWRITANVTDYQAGELLRLLSVARCLGSRQALSVSYNMDASNDAVFDRIEAAVLLAVQRAFCDIEREAVEEGSPDKGERTSDGISGTSAVAAEPGAAPAPSGASTLQELFGVPLDSEEEEECEGVHYWWEDM